MKDLQPLLQLTTDSFWRSQTQLRPEQAVVALVSDGEVAVSISDGGAGVDTPFRIASMTKSFTAAAVLRLRDSGVLTLDTPIVELVGATDTLVGPTSDSPAVTVRHLLTMAAGMASDDPWGDRMLDLSASDFQSLLDRGAFFAIAPGDGSQYSNYGYAILGSVIESVSGTSCRDYVSSTIIEPLGLNSTTWDVPRDPRTAIGAHRRAKLDVGVPLAYGAFAPMGGLWSTINDLAKWVAFFCDAFPARDGADSEVLCRASRREMQRTHTLWDPKIIDTPYGPRMTEIGYGMGLVESLHPDLGAVVHHSGGLPGFGSNMRWVPDLGVGIVALGNRTYAPMRSLTNELIEALHAAGGLPAPSRAWPTVSAELADAAEKLVNWIWRLPGSSEPDWAMNVELDLAMDVRRREADGVVSIVGQQVAWSLERSSRAAGKIVATTTSHLVTVGLSLSPEVPPRVQSFQIEYSKAVR
jgi:CubicO group peptidase (beta-lactamase class C family)